MEAYAPLLDADRSLFAWEWLRRDPAYRNAAERASGLDPVPQQFGLITFEAPDLAVPKARPMWSIDAHPYVLSAEACHADPVAERFDLEPLRPLATILEQGDGEHLLLSDGLRSVRLDAPRGVLTDAPVVLRYWLHGIASAEPPLLTLRRLLALCRTGGFARSLHPREARARRWILMLRAADALAAGAGQREIAEVLLSASAAWPRWRSREGSVRSQVQRLVRGARDMAAGGYRELLGR